MKLLLLALTIGVLVGCGEPVEPEELDTRLGLEVTPDENNKFTQREVDAISRVCTSLGNKEFLFNTRIRTNIAVEYDFEVVEKACGESDFTDPTTLTATLAKEDGDFVMNPSVDDTGFMEDVLVQDSKVLDDLCDTDIDVNTQRFALDGDYGVWVEAFNNDTGLCDKRIVNESEPATGASYCLIFTVAKKNSNDRYFIESAELFDIVTSAGNVNNGVVRKRSYSTNSSCSDDENFTRVQYITN